MCAYLCEANNAACKSPENSPFVFKRVRLYAFEKTNHKQEPTSNITPYIIEWDNYQNF